MVDINTLKVEIVEHLKPLQPEKVLLFGSFAYGKPNEESDIDLFIIKNLPKEEVKENLEIIPVTRVEEVLKYAIIKWVLNSLIFTRINLEVDQKDELQRFFYLWCKG